MTGVWDGIVSVLGVLWGAIAPFFTAQGYLYFYGALALTHVLVQYTFALSHEARLRRQSVSRSRHRRERSAGVPESIAIWVPVYQEKIEWLEFCLQRLQLAESPGRMKVIVVDDGSYLRQLGKYREWNINPPKLTRRKRFWNWVFRRKPENYQERYEYYLRKRQELDAVLMRFGADRYRFEIVRLANNVGKRHAQHAAWELSKGHYELYGTVDSDTGVKSDAFMWLARRFSNPDVAAATGYVDVGNWDYTWLTRLIDMRYWSAFHVERAAQSFWNCVMCCSGPLAVYRAEIADQVMSQYVTQRFLGKLCTFGDDRHLTNLCLALGKLVVLEPRATCWTDVPEKLSQYIPQQDRWNKSFYREMLWSLQALRTHSRYMTYDLAMQFSLPFMLLGGLGVTAYLAITGGGWGTVLQYVVTIFAVGFVRSLFPFFARRNISLGRRFGQLLFMGYGVVHILILTPVRLRALVGLATGATGWGTRQV